jgi:transcription antitermination factor NusB
VKSKFDPRHIKRIKNMQALFAYSCNNSEPVTDDTKEIITHLPEIDAIIQENAPKWTIDKINKIDLSILRYSLWELIFQKKAPPKVTIDEDIELAKEFGTETSSSFVNGVIGSATKKLGLIKKDDTESEPKTA